VRTNVLGFEHSPGHNQFLPSAPVQEAHNDSPPFIDFATEGIDRSILAVEMAANRNCSSFFPPRKKHEKNHRAEL